ncbi:hypothetical protein SAMN05446037_1002249 [Anaerovirgula multivorans]|uniref:Uncharacterized protein n=1 Tax=Anaerovirgula multivorans TaxID=312168 RepID=A0A239ATY8_9FIRM|nr:hypothetical protein [Anaerovirgula multivorans]SNR98811.1 hypothetical protein SAMN05446037_1002249 [Anaerovirgula multivorans]
MNGNQKVKSPKNLVIKIMMPVLIVAVIITIWFVKNSAEIPMVMEESKFRGQLSDCKAQLFSIGFKYF